MGSLVRIVAGHPAQGFPVILIPKQIDVAMMWLDMVYHELPLPHDSITLSTVIPLSAYSTQDAQWVLPDKRICSHLPLGILIKSHTTVAVLCVRSGYATNCRFACCPDWFDGAYGHR
jgi:hypothetical protein